MCQVQRCLFSAICLCLTAFLCGSTAAAQDVFPEREWAHGHPKDTGMDPKLLDEVAGMLGGRGCIIRHGYVVKQWGDQAKRGGWASSSKPVLSTLIFFAISEGLVRSVDQPVADFGWDLRPEDRGITFRHLGAMTSGYARPEGPGKAFAYNDFGIQLYQKTLFDKVFKADADKAASDRRRLGPLGFQDGLSFTPNRIVIASVRDFARLDLFWLHKGNWVGRQLLPESFFQRYLKPQLPAMLPHTRKADTEDYLRIGTYGGGSDHFTRFGPGIYGFNW